MGKPSRKNPSPPASKRVLIVEEPVFREGLAQVLSREPGLEICGQVGSAEEGLSAIPQLKPDVVLLDLTLPGKSGLQLIKELRAVDRQTRVLVISMHDEALYAERALRAGADGYIMKQEDPDEIAHAIKDVLQGRIYVSEAALANGRATPVKSSSPRKARLLDQLSDAQLEILELLGWGKSSDEIARLLGMKERGVDKQCAAMQAKLDLRNINELIRYAVCWVEEGK